MYLITHRCPAVVPRDVSQGTLAKANCGPARKYVSGFRRGQGERTREAILQAALSLIEAGDYRPEAVAIAERTGCCHASAVTRHFGAVHLLFRIIAREYWQRVAPWLPFPVGDDPKVVKAAVWAVLVGKAADL